MWEYKQIRINMNNLEEILNQQGMKGWEAWHMDEFFCVLYLKRFKPRRS